jgi:hypothetical protein
LAAYRGRVLADIDTFSETASVSTGRGPAMAVEAGRARDIGLNARLFTTYPMFFV